MNLFEKFPPNAAIVLISPPLGGKEDIMLSYIESKLSSKKDSREPILAILTDKSAEALKSELLKRKVFFGSSDTKLVIIDCYSLNVGEQVKSSNDVQRVP